MHILVYDALIPATILDVFLHARYFCGVSAP